MHSTSGSDDVLATVSLDLALAHRVSENVLFTADLDLQAVVFSDNRELDAIDMLASAGPWIALGESPAGQVIARPYRSRGRACWTANPTTAS